ncbi:VIN3-like protein 1 isoform X2 [Syzygium oleosum]|uniref:VIN3-like protein 1 isoform X2 n=1 Tax=Syzygium oleosum TaxID=219896 RepID=UPI0024BAC7C8|nr:VIN3-like protein 1 isoform X2 [Syzygium oleosum]XP_056162032.1 VIN3-like protein 1 isoform X2 [Syzygium oleosum]
MDLEDKFLAKGIQSLSSSVQSTPEKNGNSDDASKSPDLLQEFLKSGLKKELLRTCFDKDKKNSASSKSKMREPLKPNNKSFKKQDHRKASNSPSNQPSSKKQTRKGDNPMRLPPAIEQALGFGHSKSWICKNSACRAVLSTDDTFCKRCSCCICHLFDDNKDPSLWLVCSSESDNGVLGSCGLSCHIECALQREKAGVVDLGQLMQLDGSYCCASCGKVSGILGSWKKQLAIAKDARRVDVLCYRICLSYRLLDGTSRFKDLHEYAKDAKAKLETEVGPINGVSAKMARGIVSRLSVAGDVQRLCSLAVERAEELLVSASNGNITSREESRPAACKFLFEEVTSSSVIIVLIELSSPSSDDIKGYKLWYHKSGAETREEPACVFPRDKRRILISNLQPCTEYSFHIISYTEEGDLGHSEAKCFTNSVEIIHKNHNPLAAIDGNKERALVEGSSSGSNSKPESTDAVAFAGFKVRDLGKILHLASAQERGCFEGFCSADMERCCGISKRTEPKKVVEDYVPSVPRELDLNVASVPDLNEAAPPYEFSRDEDNGCLFNQVVEVDDDAASHELRKHNGAGPLMIVDSRPWTCGAAAGEAPGADSQAELCRKRALSMKEELHDCDSTLINGSPSNISSGSGSLDDNFEDCVKIIRELECRGHINQEFRLKFLTWFSLRSTEQERRVVNTFVQALSDDRSSLAGQLVDTFSDVVSSKMPRNGFCNRHFFPPPKPQSEANSSVF